MNVDIERVIRDYLPNVIHLSLGTSINNKPWVCEVHFAYDDKLNLYFRSLSSRRHSQEISANSNVAGNIVRQFKIGEYPVGVYFEGNAEQLIAVSEQDTAYEVISKRFDLGQGILDDAQNPGGHQFYKIVVDTFYVFGKFGDEGGQKYELTWDGGAK